MMDGDLTTRWAATAIGKKVAELKMLLLPDKA
jgi:hypothetical protein